MQLKTRRKLSPFWTLWSTWCICPAIRNSKFVTCSSGSAAIRTLVTGETVELADRTRSGVKLTQSRHPAYSGQASQCSLSGCIVFMIYPKRPARLPPKALPGCQ